MSKLIRDASAKELNMPKYKVMGTISEDTSSLIADLVKDNDTSGVPRIMDELTRFLGPVTNISADLYDTPVDHIMAVSRNYKDPTSVFFLNVSYNISPEFFIDNVSYNMPRNTIVFVNHRYPHRLVHQQKQDMILMSGNFTWSTK